MIKNVLNNKITLMCGSQNLCLNDNCEKCFKASFASHERVKFWSTKNEKSPREFAKSSHKKCIFDCVCGHDFLLQLYSKSWCPYCANKKLCEDEKCLQCYYKSFASTQNAKIWSNNNELTPRQVFKSSGKLFWFKCECNHEFQLKPNGNHGCSYCAHQKLCDDEDCKMCLENSFASHEKTNFWSEKNKLTSRQVFKNTHKQFWFDCDKCNHDFLVSLTNLRDDHWCPYCAHQKLCENKDCRMCFENSFASDKRVKFWDYDKNIILPRQIFKGNSQKNIWFICEKKHSFPMRIGNITCHNQWCGQCQYKTEEKLFMWLQEHFTVKRQIKVSWCKNKETNRYFPFDFGIEEFKILIELDGRQHFVQVKNWQSPEDTTERDIFKMVKANENGYTVIRLLQDDVFRDKFDWKKKLLKKIKLYSKPKKKFICAKNSEVYDKHK